MRIIKFAIPIAVLFCFGAFGLPLEGASSKRSSSVTSKKSESGTRKKSSNSKRSAKARKKSSKAKSRQGAKSKEKSQRRTAEAATWLDRIEELPAVELPEEDGPPEDDLFETVSDSAP